MLVNDSSFIVLNCFAVIDTAKMDQEVELLNEGITLLNGLFSLDELI